MFILAFTDKARALEYSVCLWYSLVNWQRPCFGFTSCRIKYCLVIFHHTYMEYSSVCNIGACFLCQHMEVLFPDTTNFLYHKNFWLYWWALCSRFIIPANTVINLLYVQWYWVGYGRQAPLRRRALNCVELNCGVNCVIEVHLQHNWDHFTNTNYYPLLRVRSWNNGMGCMSFYILTDK